METKDQAQEPNMATKGSKVLTAAQQLALDLTADQPAAKMKWHSLKDFAMNPPPTDEEYEAFIAALAELRADDTGAKDPLED